MYPNRLMYIAPKLNLGKYLFLLLLSVSVLTPQVEILSETIKLRKVEFSDTNKVIFEVDPMFSSYYNGFQKALVLYHTQTFSENSNLDSTYFSVVTNLPSDNASQHTIVVEGESLRINRIGPKIEFAENEFIYSKKVEENYDLFLKNTFEANLTNTTSLDELNPRISPDRNYIAFMQENSLFILNSATNQREFIISGAEFYSFSPNSRLVATSTYKNDLHIYDLSKRTFIDLEDSISLRFRNPVFIDDLHLVCYDMSPFSNYELVLLNIYTNRNISLLKNLLPYGVYAFNMKMQELYILINATGFQIENGADESVYVASSGVLHVLSVDWNVLKKQLE
jgi:WD40 repeat protein